MKRAFLAIVLALAAVAQPAMAQTRQAKPNHVFVVLRDLSASYCCVEEANARLIGMVATLPPASRLYLIDVSSDFTAKSVPVILDIPAAPDLPKGITLSERRHRDQLAANYGARVRALRAPIVQFLTRPVAVRSKWTRLHAGLEYATRLFRDTPDARRHLLVFSDMVNDVPGVGASDRPPSAALGADGVRVGQFFVPYDAGFDAKEKAWREFWLERGAAEVRMVDSVLSRVAALY